jgi:RimJ/RimL family protein N-acetyltransferase
VSQGRSRAMPSSGPARERPIELRKVLPSDLDVLFEHQCDPEACRVAGFVSRARPAFDAHWRKILSDPSKIIRAILCEGAVVGNVCSFEEEEWRVAGYWIGREWWGRGIATRALGAFLEVDTTRPLHALVSIENPASMRVLEKCGFARLERRPNPAAGGEDFLYVLEL